MHKGKPFTDLLGEVENGQLLRELTEAVYNVVAAVVDTRKPGKLKLALDFAPTGKNTVKIDADFSTTEPEHDRPTTTFFVGNDLTLLRDDPRQERLPLQAVPDDHADDEPIKVGG